ncbi:N-carbamoyl-L-amino-acid hydrolase [Lentibacillus halodurans]|uniref:N-carbamoyl-L-amino-acid hydrolase n=1 Tax=Lentibacillus halodurans TaxID=237679 RepID=A0A1I0YDF8_9BACI|nr:N-carbamoyl-L-amino-acid hydrolase [Lentibacillus halodurans]
MNEIKIDFTRLRETIKKSSQIGAIPKNGLCRLALSQKDKAMREIFKEWMSDAGLKVRVDDFGNMYGRREGRTDLPPLVAGSHLDTQPNGGRFDGVLGVLAALEVIRCLNDHEVETYRPIEIINFTNEEGARFEPPLLGSGGLTGVFDKEYVYTRQDKVGKQFKDELKQIGFNGAMHHRLQLAHAFIELHIEQGPVLEKEGVSIGVVEGIKGMTWLELHISGEGGHAGPTPMLCRKDALMAASRMLVCAEEKALNFDHGLNVTVGRMNVKPGAVNCIPEAVTFSLDIRHLEDRIREQFIEELTADLQLMASELAVSMDMNELWKVKTSHFHDRIISQISNSSERMGYSYKRLYSGAGHDAKYMNTFTPTGMIFLPSVNGKSHVESELTLDKDIEHGTNVLLDSMIQLANMKEAI